MATTYYKKNEATGEYAEADPFGDASTAEDMFDVEKAKKATEVAKLYAGVAVGASKEKAQQLQEFKQQDEARDALQAKQSYRY